MRRLGGWRQFRPRVRTEQRSLNLLIRAERETMSRLQAMPRRRFRRADLHDLAPLIRQARQHADENRGAYEWLILLLLMTPRTVVLQRQMDRSPGQFAHTDPKLIELIDFNDTYVATVLAFPEPLLAEFDEQLKPMMDRVCKFLKTPCFSNEQYVAITKGLTREIAVYRGALKEGLEVELTTRAEDAMGVDLVVSDGAGRAINIDVKTRSSFHFRIKDLEREGRISERQALLAEDTGYCPVTNGHGSEARHVILLRIDNEVLGEIVHFAFENSHMLGETLRMLLKRFGEAPVSR